MPPRKFTTQIAGPVLSAAAILMATTLAARADITPAELWQDWQAQATASGQTLTVGDTVESGSTLTLTDVRFDVANGTDRMSGTIPQIVLAGAGGAVDVTLSPEYPVVFEGAIEADPEAVADGEEASAPARVTVLVRHPGLALHASGALEDLRYRMTMPTFTATVQEVETDGTPDDSLELEMSVNGAAGDYHVTGPATAARQITARTTAETAGVALSQSGAEDGERYQMTLSAADLESTSTGALPAFTGGAGLTEMLRLGLASSGSLRHGLVNMTVTDESTGEPSTVEAKAERGSADYALTEGVLAYKGETEGTSLAVSGAAGAPPLSLAADRASFELTAPLTKTESPAPFRLVTAMDGLRADEILWAQLDPDGVLPRDPASLTIGLSGTLRWLEDAFATTATDMEGDLPVEFDTINIDTLSFSAAGAALTGSGAFTIDNSDTTTWDGLPKPVGSLELLLKGGETLIDNLVQVGLIPPQQAMVAKMMLTGFSKPGPEPDTLTTKIDLTSNGGVRANGRSILP